MEEYQSTGKEEVALELLGIPPTDREVAWEVIDIVRVRDGLMVEHWNVVDAYGLMAQLGAIPAG